MNKPSVQLLLLAMAWLLATGCAAPDDVRASEAEIGPPVSLTSEDEVFEDLSDPTPPPADEPQAGEGPSEDSPDGLATSTEAIRCPCNNCVEYARCRQPRLPYGLTTFRDKQNIINSRNPRRGCVAVIRTGSQWGHVAYVTEVNGTRIRVSEGNWPSNRCGSRIGTARQLNIVGYWCPR